MRYLSLVLLASALVASASAQTVLDAQVYNGHTYSLLSPSLWADAEAKAVSLGGHLATVNDQAENDWVFATFHRPNDFSYDLWLGLSEIGSTGSFAWSSGAPLTYTNWANGGPVGIYSNTVVAMFATPGP